MRFSPVILIWLLLAPLSLPLQVQSKPMTYPQLLSTRYATGTPLPADFQRPAPTFDFVERAKLPAGAKVLSAARAKSGVVWAVTDRGVFRSQGAQVVSSLLMTSFSTTIPSRRSAATAASSRVISSASMVSRSSQPEMNARGAFLAPVSPEAERNPASPLVQ